LVSPVAFKLPGDPDTTVAAALYVPEGDRQLDALLIFAHGAGAGHFHPFMTNYASGLATRGVTVVTFNFPYMEKKRRTPDRAPVLEDAFRRAVVGAVEHRHVKASKLFIGGKSMGGRMATHLAAQKHDGLRGVIALGYPLHPPGKPEQLRVAHLPSIDVPLLIVQGERDAFGTPEELRPIVGTLEAQVTVHVVAGGDHSLAVRRATDYDAVAETVAGWIQRV
jgi:uncharacterized protein